MFRIAATPAVSLCLLLAAVVAAPAQTNPSVRIRGTIENVDGPILHIKSRDGQELTVRLTDDYTASVVVKASLADIKQGVFLGTTALPQSDGTLKAVEIHIFPEALRGTGEGFRPWDLLPNSTMTNATVTSSVTSVDGGTITLTYKGGEKKIVIPPGIPILTFAPAETGDVHAGVAVSLNAEKLPDGTLRANRLTVGKNGVAPAS